MRKMKLIKVNFLSRVLLIIFSFFAFLFIFKSSALAGLRVCRDCDDCNCAASCGSGGASDWNYEGCGKDDCSSTETYRKRTVYTCSCGKYAICRVEEECVYSSSCVPACSNTSDCGHTCAANSCDACACDNDPRSSAYSWSSLGCSSDCGTCYCGKPKTTPTPTPKPGEPTPTPEPGESTPTPAPGGDIIMCQLIKSFHLISSISSYLVHINPLKSEVFASWRIK